MSIVAYPGTTFNSIQGLTVDSSIAMQLESNDDWLAPAKVQLLDPDDGIIYHEELIDNPQPRVVGMDLVFDYAINFVIPEVPKGFYLLKISRYTVSSSSTLTIDGIAVDGYGAEDVLCVNTDTNTSWVLKDHNPNATVTWEMNFTRNTSQTAKIDGTTNKIMDGADAYFESPAFSPFNEGLPPSLDPITIIWTVADSPARKRKQLSSLYNINVSQLTAVNELKMFFDRLIEEKRLPSLEYSPADYCRWLKQGLDMFNAGGLFTTFNMTNATGPIKHWWFVCSTISALRNMYMLEGQRAFSFSGQSVTLDVDMTQYLQSLMGDLSSAWDADKLSFKTQLKQYGLSGGDGNMDYAKFQAGAVGLSMGPASNFGGFMGARNILGGLRFF